MANKFFFRIYSDFKFLSRANDNSYDANHTIQNTVNRLFVRMSKQTWKETTTTSTSILWWNKWILIPNSRRILRRNFVDAEVSKLLQTTKLFIAWMKVWKIVKNSNSNENMISFIIAWTFSIGVIQMKICIKISEAINSTHYLIDIVTINPKFQQIVVCFMIIFVLFFVASLFSLLLTLKLSH